MRKNKNNTIKNVIEKRVLLTKGMKKVIKDIMKCYMMACAVVFLLIIFYWEEAASLPLTRSVLIKLANNCFLILLTVLGIKEMSKVLLNKLNI